MRLALVDRKILRLVVLCALYLAQGIPWGFAAVTLLSYLKQGGAGAETRSSLEAIIVLPFALKFVWGPVMDRFGIPAMGHRRPWILFAQLMMVLTLAVMILVPNLTTGLATFGILLFLHNLFQSMQDVAVDALAVDILSEKERGTANGLMYGSKYLGSIFGAVVLSSVLDDHGLRTALAVQVVLLSLITMLPLFVKEHAKDALWPWSRALEQTRSKTPLPSIGKLFRALKKALFLRSSLLAGALALLVFIAAAVVGTITLDAMLESGWQRKEYDHLIGGWGQWLGFGGSICGGWLADRLGHKRVAAAATCLLGALWICFGCLEEQWTSRLVVTVVMLAAPFLLAVLSVSLFALFMDVSWPVVAATQFTAYMAFLNLSTIIGKRLVGQVTNALSWNETYVAAGVFQIAIIVLLIPIDPKQTRSQLGESSEYLG